MAPFAMPCEFVGCWYAIANGCRFKTAKTEPGIAIQLLAQLRVSHGQQAVGQVQQPPQVVARQPQVQQPPQVSAQAVFSCSANGCGFKTAKAEPGIAIQLLAQHRLVQHTLVQQAVGQVVLKCANGCGFVTPKAEPRIATQLLTFHQKNLHTHVQQAS